MLLGAVGQLQFEVVQHRLKGEYDCDVRLEGCQYTGARWITADTPAELREFTNAYPTAAGAGRGQHAGLPVHLARTTCGWRRSASRRSIFIRCASMPGWRWAALARHLSSRVEPVPDLIREPGIHPCTRSMQPLSDWPLEDRRQLVGVFTDIDDTLTTDGAITPDALAALGALKAAGLHVIPITGRPVGWSEPFARTLAGGRHRG